MTAVRNTPARRRMTCPECGRDSAYSNPWVPNTGWGSDSLMRDTTTALFTRHNTPQGQPCTVNGSNNLGRSIA